jgi:hypothetical protein
MSDKIEIEPGVFLLPQIMRVVFEKDHMTWPLPRGEIAGELTRLPWNDGEGGEHAVGLVRRRDALESCAILNAYEHLIWCNREKRQRVIRCLRKALEVLSEREP